MLVYAYTNNRFLNKNDRIDTMNSQTEKNMFTDNFHFCTTNEEIKSLQESNPKLDPYYIASSVIEERRSLFNMCYSLFEPYKDSNFLKEIKTNFHQRTWEMYLGYFCLTHNKQLKEIGTAEGNADIEIIAGENPIFIECTAVTHGDPSNADRVPEMHISDINNIVVRDVPEDKILLRITQSLNEKLKQYNQRLADQRVEPDSPYIVAINTGELGHPEHIPRILKAVFGIGYLTLRMRENGNPIPNPPSFWSRRQIISKTSGVDIEMTFFEKEESKGISAVIYSNDIVLHHLTNPERGLILVHNPLASNPIPLEEFSFLTQHYVDKKTGDIIKLEPQEKL